MSIIARGGLKNPNNVVLFIFLFTTLSGVVRKWILPLGIVNNLVLVIQLLLPIVFVFLPNRATHSLLLRIMPIYLVALILLALNPLNQTIYHGVFGVVLHFGFWYALAYYLNNRTYFNLRKLFPVFVIVSVFQIILATIQYGLPMNHILNRYVAETDTVAMVGNAVRVSGTFSYIGGFGAYMIFYAFLVMSLIKMRYHKNTLIFLILLGFLGCLMNGSRSITFFYTLCLFLSASISLIINLLQGSIKLISILFLLVILGLGGGVITLINKSSDNFFNRVETTRASGEEDKRIVEPIADIIEFDGKYQLFGRGLGGTYQGANAIWGESIFITEYGGYEEEPERILLEGGYFLFLIKLLLWYLFFRESKIKKWLLGIIIMLILLYFIYTFNIFNGIYILIGLILLDQTYYINENNYSTPGYTAR